MVQFDNARQLAASLHPEVPVICRRPALAARAGRFFTSKFPGHTYYAVKANPAPWLQNTLYSAGITHFDVASLTEIRLLRELLPHATLAFMHPVKAEKAISEAYHDHGVRSFSLDSLDELEKIRRATSDASDLTLVVRLQAGSDLAKISLASKFGASDDAEAELLQRTRHYADRLGVAFHVGSQAMSPIAFGVAMDRAEEAVRRAGIILDVLDVGGGFPAIYPGMEPPALEAYFDEIASKFETFPSAGNAELWCEPGRALSADAESLIVRVEGRKGDVLYINDGAYGALYDAAHLAWRFPTVNLSREGKEQTFTLFGPTCDDADQMRGPFFLPEHTEAGDYIEFGTLGAYGRGMATKFNGYGQYIEAELSDDPFPSLTCGPQDKAAEEAYP